MGEIIGWLLLGAVIWYLLDTIAAKERAVRIAGEACRHQQLQLLDETVVLERLRTRRDTDGRLRWLRYYRFEVSLDGDQRRHGSVVLLGNRPLSISLELDGYAVHESPKDD